MFMYSWSISTSCSENLLWNLPRFLARYLGLIFLDRWSTEILVWRSNTEIQSPRNCVLSICTFTTLLLLPIIAFDDFAYQPHCGQLRKTHIVVNDVSAKWIFSMTLLSMEVLNQKVCSCELVHKWAPHKQHDLVSQDLFKVTSHITMVGP